MDFFFNELMEYGPCKYSNEISRACEYLEDEGILEGSRVDFKDYEQEQILQICLSSPSAIIFLFEYLVIDAEMMINIDNDINKMYFMHGLVNKLIFDTDSYKHHLTRSKLPFNITINLEFPPFDYKNKKQDMTENG